MAVALVIFARWNPMRCLYASLLFGGAGALGPALQSVGITTGYYLFNAAPYVLTLLIMIATSSPTRTLVGRAGGADGREMKSMPELARRRSTHDVTCPPIPIPGPTTAICARETPRSSSSTCRPTSAARAATSTCSATTSRSPARRIEPIKRVLAAMRASGFHVFHTREGHRPDLADLPANKRWRSRADRRRHRRSRARAAACSCAASRAGRSSPSSRRAPGEPIIDKPGKGSFCATDLELLLRAARHRQHRAHRHHHRRLRAHHHARGQRPRLRVPAAGRLLRRDRSRATTPPRSRWSRCRAACSAPCRDLGAPSSRRCCDERRSPPLRPRRPSASKRST